MKPDPGIVSGIWFRQAEHDLVAGERDYGAADYSEACYHAEQTAQKALKGYLLAMGERNVPIHSIQQLLMECGLRNGEFLKERDTARVLEQYYIPTRYPDALAGSALPCESYTAGQARQALDGARRLLALARRLGGGGA
jgi:HEPN domain-containing protein